MDVGTHALSLRYAIQAQAYTLKEIRELVEIIVPALVDENARLQDEVWRLRARLETATGGGA